MHVADDNDGSDGNDTPPRILRSYRQHVQQSGGRGGGSGGDSLHSFRGGGGGKKERHSPVASSADADFFERTPSTPPSASSADGRAAAAAASLHVGGFDDRTQRRLDFGATNVSNANANAAPTAAPNSATFQLPPNTPSDVDGLWRAGALRVASRSATAAWAEGEGEGDGWRTPPRSRSRSASRRSASNVSVRRGFEGPSHETANGANDGAAAGNSNDGDGTALCFVEAGPSFSAPTVASLAKCTPHGLALQVALPPNPNSPPRGMLLAEEEPIALGHEGEGEGREESASRPRWVSGSRLAPAAVPPADTTSTPSRLSRRPSTASSYAPSAGRASTAASVSTSNRGAAPARNISSSRGTANAAVPNRLGLPERQPPRQAVLVRDDVRAGAKR